MRVAGLDSDEPIGRIGQRKIGKKISDSYYIIYAGGRRIASALHPDWRRMSSGAEPQRRLVFSRVGPYFYERRNGRQLHLIFVRRFEGEFGQGGTKTMHR